MMLKKHKINVKGLKIIFYTHGYGEPLIFLPGGFYTTWSYLPLIRILGKRYKVYSLHLPGQGCSQIPNEKWNANDFAELVDIILKKLKLKNITIAAHCITGIIAMLLSLKNKNIKKLILMNSMGVKMPYNNRMHVFGKLVLSNTFNILTTPRGLLQILRVPLLSLFNLFKIILIAKFRRLVHENYMLHFENGIDNVKIRTIIIWGKKDKFLNLEYAKKLASRIKNSKLFFVKGGHDWPVTNPREILKVLR